MKVELDLLRDESEPPESVDSEHEEESGSTAPKSPSDNARVAIRMEERVAVYREEGIFARLYDEDDRPLGDKLQLHDVSLGGLAVLAPATIAAQLMVAAEYTIQIERCWADPLRAKVRCQRVERYQSHRTTKTGLAAQSYRVGFELIREQFFDIEQAESEFSLLRLPETQQLEGYLFKEPFYREPARLGVTLFGTRALQFRLFDSQCLLMAGMEMEICLNRCSEDPIRVVVRQLERLPHHALVFCEVLRFPRSLHQPLVTELMALEWFTPRELRQSGFKINKVSDSFRFRFVRTETQYQEVLQLRLDCYRDAGKAAADADVADMRAPLDPISRILTVYHGDKLIASCAMAFPENEQTILDTERTLSDGYPSALPSKLDIIEVSRMCVDVQYRGGDILNRIFEQMYRVCIASDRTYLLSSTDDRLWRLYRSIGFRKTPYRYDHPVFTGVDHTIILLHVDTAMFARHLPLKRWREVYQEVNRYMQLRAPTRYTIRAAARGRALRLFDTASLGMQKMGRLSGLYRR